jgi:hypothetical protein
MGENLCESCAHRRVIVSGKGSRFLLCLLSKTDSRYPKYPRQPVRRCSGYEARRDEDGPATAKEE